MSVKFVFLSVRLYFCKKGGSGPLYISLKIQLDSCGVDVKAMGVGG